MLIRNLCVRQGNQRRSVAFKSVNQCALKHSPPIQLVVFVLFLCSCCLFSLFLHPLPLSLLLNLPVSFNFRVSLLAASFPLVSILFSSLLQSRLRQLFELCDILHSAHRKHHLVHTTLRNSWRRGEILTGID